MLAWSIGTGEIIVISSLALIVIVKLLSTFARGSGKQ